MGNYAAVSEVSGFKVDGETVDLSGYTQTEISDEILFAERFVEAITNDIFYEKTATYTFDGTGLPKLFFHPKVPYRLILINSVKDLDLDGSTVLHEYTENLDFKKYDYYLETARSFPGDTPRRMFVGGGVWPKGQNNIQVSGKWGRSAVPEEIKRATILLTLERLSPGSTGIEKSEIKSGSWPDFSITFSEGKRITGELTGYPAVDRLLHNYINWIDIFQAIPDDKQTHDRRFN